MMNYQEAEHASVYSESYVPQTPGNAMRRVIINIFLS
jgi:hypothetical protein